MDLNLGFFRNVVLRNPPGRAQCIGHARNRVPALKPDPADFRQHYRSRQQSNSFGFSNIGPDTNTNQVNITNTYRPFGSVTKTFGPHTLKFGASLRKNQFNSYNPATSPEGRAAV